MANESEQPVECAMARAPRFCLATLYTCMGVAGTVLNLMVIYLVASFKKLRTPSNAFIVNGCVANLLVCAFWMPHEAVILCTGNGSLLHEGYEVFKEATLFLGITVSLLAHSLIAVNRCVLITKPPATYHALYQRRNTEWMITGSWLIAVACLVPWLTVPGQPPEGCRSAAASFTGGGRSVLTNSLACATLACTVTGQTAVVLYCYFKIFRRVQISVKRVSILNFQLVNNLPYSFPRKDKRLGLYMLAVCSVFVGSTGPLLWALVAGLFVPVPTALRTALWVLFCTLFVTDPFLYTWKNEEFRKCLRAALNRGSTGSTVGVEPEPINISTISHALPRQNSRRAFLADPT